MPKVPVQENACYENSQDNLSMAESTLIQIAGFSHETLLDLEPVTATCPFRIFLCLFCRGNQHNPKHY